MCVERERQEMITGTPLWYNPVLIGLHDNTQAAAMLWTRLFAKSRQWECSY